jgi:hypothetical protein
LFLLPGWLLLTARYLLRLVTAASVGVLAVSNGYPVDEWTLLGGKAKPSTLVAALSPISNFLLAYAFHHGVAVLFWTHAVSGTTVDLSLLAPYLSYCSSAF